MKTFIVNLYSIYIFIVRYSKEGIRSLRDDWSPLGLRKTAKNITIEKWKFNARYWSIYMYNTCKYTHLDEGKIPFFSKCALKVQRVQWRVLNENCQDLKHFYGREMIICLMASWPRFGNNSLHRLKNTHLRLISGLSTKYMYTQYTRQAS